MPPKSRLLGAALAAVALVLAIVLPVVGAAVGPTKLEHPAVDPRTATSADLITFSVVYRNTKGLAPDYVRVVVGPASYPMTAAGADWKAGVLFSVQSAIPTGTHGVRFEARDGEKFADMTAGGTVTIPAVTLSTVAVAIWMAFMLFKKRRRDEELPAAEPVLQAAAGSGFGRAPDSTFAPPVDPEANIPRWRRPSLIDARRTDPVRSPVHDRVPMAFTVGGSEGVGVGVGVGVAERRVVRHAVTSLLDWPDEVRSVRVGDLVAGDEVQVHGRTGAYCEVACPDGRRGWVHRTTLGELVVPTVAHGDRDVEPPVEAEDALAALLAHRSLAST